MESKLAEVGTVLTELGGLPERAKRRSSQQQRRKSGFVELVESPDQKEWKNRQTMGGVVAGERQPPEGRLPVILEGKHYPRRSLESLEISRLLHEDTGVSDSPELGPPPIAHFDVAEPIDFAGARTPACGTAEMVDGYLDNQDDIKPLPNKLESRRRRRASALLEDMSLLNAPTADAAEQKTSLKSGAKRKLDAREDGSRREPGPSELDDFAFQRKATASETPQARPKGSRFTKSGTPSISSTATTRDSATKLEPRPRKVLAPKSTNSPSKSRITSPIEKGPHAKHEIAHKAKLEEHVGQQNMKSTAGDPSKYDRPTRVEDIVLSQQPGGLELAPKTPAGLGLFSPVSTEPSTRTVQQSEIALTASVEDVLGGTDGRTSRRARGAVSYAEPSLRAKMRRPTKELVAAVGDQTNGFKAHQRDSSARAESQERQPSRDLSVVKTRTVTIKHEKPNDEPLAWKGLPEATEEPASPLVHKLPRFPTRDAPPEAGPETENPPKENAGTQQLEAAVESLSIFDSPESSPHDSPNIILVGSRKTSRRHSSNPASLRRVGQEFGKPDNSSDRPLSKHNTSGISDRLPRPSSAASLRKENITRDEKAGLKRSASVTTFTSLAGAVVAPDDGIPSGGAVAGRTERAAARRKSMMV